MYLNYRLERINGLEAQIKEAIKDYYTRFQLLPSGIVVPTRAVEEATHIAAALELKIPVTGTGGCLANEVWLEV